MSKWEWGNVADKDLIKGGGRRACTESNRRYTF